MVLTSEIIEGTAIQLDSRLYNVFEVFHHIGIWIDARFHQIKIKEYTTEAVEAIVR